MKKMLLAAVGAACLTLTSCGVAQTASNNLTETKVVLSSNNFKVVGQASGECTATYILGFGGLRHKALKANAIDEMSKNAHLTGAQTLTNVTVHSSMKMITPFFVQVTYSATANIVEFQ